MKQRIPIVFLNEADEVAACEIKVQAPDARAAAGRGGLVLHDLRSVKINVASRTVSKNSWCRPGHHHFT